MRTILEVLADFAPTVTDVAELTAQTRLALGRAITQDIFPGNGELQVIGLDATLERILLQALNNGSSLEPGLADSLLQKAQNAVTRQEERGLAPVLLVQHALRPMLARFLRRNLPQLTVLSHAEIPDSRSIKMVSTIGEKA